MTVELTPPPPPVDLGTVTITMPTESAIALAAVLSGLPLSEIDDKIAYGKHRVFDVFGAIYDQLVVVSKRDHNVAYASAKNAVRTVGSFIRKDLA